MKKMVLLFATLLFVASIVNAETRYVKTYTPTSQERFCSFGNQDRNISRIENRVFDRTFQCDTPEERISRLENQLFGASQSGDLQQRLNNVKKASSNQSRFREYGYPNYDNYYTPPIVAGSGWRSMLHSFGNHMLGGMPTGITPQMDPAYMDYFEAERNAMKFGDGGNYGDVRTNRSWHRYNTRRGSSTGVTLID